MYKEVGSFVFGLVASNDMTQQLYTKTNGRNIFFVTTKSLQGKQQNIVFKYL